MQTQRIAYLDLIKATATFAVVLTHVTARLFSLYEVGSSEWVVVDLLDSLTRWAVPAFLMVNGALTLGGGSHSFSVRELWAKRIPRLVLTYVLWSTLYAIYHVLAEGWGGWVSFACSIVRGEYHLWFLPMFIVVSALQPILRLIARDERVLNYACVAFCVSLFASYVPLLTGSALGSALSSLVSDAYVPVAYAGYALLGYRLSTTDLPRRWRLVTYACAAVGPAVTALGTLALSMRSNALVDLYDNLLPNVLVVSSAVFVALRTKDHLGREGARRCLEFVSTSSLGTYLVHPLLIYLLSDPMLGSVALTSPWLALLWAGGITMLAVLIAKLLKRLPLVRWFA